MVLNMFEFYNTSLNYLDPGTGSYFLQILFAAGITLGVYFRNFRVFITNIYAKFKEFLKL